ncbi:hypothetical protein EST38_g12152 [Candolleomyces aberdarensis]|uniref:Nephrocystin 3-like N-terminal domain-containing protein n=1 Tax=Candolleomyces aberdarensis TaxID=2316362 RepID=A0A4Q2D336_9AGAR|nr:hypothetical protein EST38_g12152 [Candolleomyces aberdarensis]
MSYYLTICALSALTWLVVLQYLQQYAATGALPLCHPGTRKAVIDRIKAWYGYKEPPNDSIMVVHAPAGYEKSAVAQFIADDLEQQEDLDFNPLAGSFFFSRASPERSNPAHFIATLAYQFATFIPELLPFIEDVVRRNPMILNKTLELQLEKLIIGPFRSVKGLDEMPNRLIIVDGLDECINLDRKARVEKQYAQDQELAQIRVLDLIHTLQSHRFPLFFLIFSRPEPWIKAHVESMPFCDNAQTLDMYMTADNLRDVESVLRKELEQISVIYGCHSSVEGEAWPGKERLQKLVEKTRGDMLYANTIILDLRDPYEDPQERLNLILDPSFDDGADLAHSAPFSFVYEHFRQILRSCPSRNRPLMLEVLADLVVSHQIMRDADIIPIEEGDISLALGALDELSGRVRGRGIKALRGLHSVIKLRPHRSGSSPFFLNGLFIRFLKNPKCSGEFAVDTKSASLRLLTACMGKAASVGLDKKIRDDDHCLRFAVLAWPKYWWRWTLIDGLEHSKVLHLFLSLNLTACFVHAFSLHPGRFSLSSLLPESLFEHIPAPPSTSPQSDDQVLPETIVASRKAEYPDHAELVAQCISHLRSSVGAALVHLLDLSLVDSSIQKRPLSYALVCYLIHIQCKDEGDWRSDPVVQALKRLRTSQSNGFGQLIEYVLEQNPDLTSYLLYN